MGELENEWANILSAADVAVRTIVGYSKCNGFAGAGICFGCRYCHRGVISDSFVYVLGDGEIRVFDRTGDLANIMNALIEGTARDTVANEWVYGARKSP